MRAAKRRANLSLPLHEHVLVVLLLLLLVATSFSSNRSIVTVEAARHSSHARAAAGSVSASMAPMSPTALVVPTSSKKDCHNDQTKADAVCESTMDVDNAVAVHAAMDVVASSSTSYKTLSCAVARGGDSSGSSALMQDILYRLKIASYFALWYALNIVYNIINKKVLNVLPAPLTVGSIQFGVGALYASTLWLLRLRRAPPQSSYSKGKMSHIGFHHAVGQLLSMVSLGAGPVSFTHIVKALEPFFSAIVSALVFNKWMEPQVYATLLPVVGGVGYACLKERAFSWLAFGTAMGSNVAFALRAVLSKTAMMSSSSSTTMTAANMFGLITWAAFLISIPIALLGEGATFPDLWEKAVSQVSGGETKLMQQVVLSGLFHYLNNEVMYLALSNVHPVTLAVGNTMKRVFIMVASVLVFRNPVSLQAGVGAFIGISGVLLYSLTKQHYEQQAAAATAAMLKKNGGGKRAKQKALKDVGANKKKQGSAGFRKR